MENHEVARVFVDLYTQQMKRFGETQNIEWKANFGVWTLLAGAIYLALQIKEHFQVLTIAPCIWVILSVVLVSGVFAHGLWLSKIHDSLAFDKKLWVTYRKEALKNLNANHDVIDLGDMDQTSTTKIVWLWLEIGVSLILSVILVLVLNVHN
jgi:hypothetical protein